jgi:hypothetical protein
MRFKPSTKKDKRFMVTFENGKVVHFGAKKGQTYIDHKDKAKRAAWIARHRVREDWNDPYSAGALSRFLLWGDSTDFETNHRAFMRKFKVG